MLLDKNLFPCPLGDFVLHNNQHYYATTHLPLTTQLTLKGHGDFVTAPEVSQLFGEIIAISIASYLQSQKCTSAILIELGPGYGTLCHDVLRCLSRWQLTIEKVFLVETSPLLKAQQAQTLSNYDITWLDNIEQLAKQQLDVPLIILANEFLDALGSDLYKINSCGQSSKALIELHDNYYALTFIPHNLPPWLTQSTIILQQLIDAWQLLHQTEAQHLYIEYSQRAIVTLEIIVKLLQKHRGIATIIDYGDNYLFNIASSLRIIKKHRHYDFEELNSGELFDLSQKVNFYWLLNYVEKFQQLNSSEKDSELYYTYNTQQEFLLRYGITYRAQQLQAINSTTQATQTSKGPLSDIGLQHSIQNLAKSFHENTLSQNNELVLPSKLTTRDYTKELNYLIHDMGRIFKVLNLYANIPKIYTK